ncbi:MAG: hypothetical protein L0G22_00790 [Propionibacteriaceae bacterium]|nr:hypothetical protein [Propionibacteriaceae bacterium]
MIVHEHTVEAEVDPAVVWERWTQVEHWPVDDPDVQRAKLNGPVAQGAIGWVRPTNGPRIPFRIAQVDRVRGRFVVEAKLILCALRLEHEMDRVDADADGQVDVHDGHRRITHRVVLEGPLARLYDRLTGARQGRGLPTVMGNIIAIARV